MAQHIPRFLDADMDRSLTEDARALPGAVSRRFSPGNQVRYLPTLNGKIVRPGGVSGVPFDGYRTHREAVNKARDIKRMFRDEIAQANEGI